MFIVATIGNILSISGFCFYDETNVGSLFVSGFLVDFCCPLCLDSMDIRLRIRFDMKPNPICMTKITLNDRFNYEVALRATGSKSVLHLVQQQQQR